MNNLISPYDSGEFQVAENAYKIKVEDLVSEVQKELKLSLLRSHIDALGTEIKLTTSKTRFNGERFWFVCPQCKHRIGILYKHPISNALGCRTCLGLKYKSQRYKGMIEAEI